MVAAGVAMPADVQGVFVHGNRLQLARELAGRVRELSQLIVWRGLVAIAVDWAMISVSFALALSLQNPVVWIAAALVIATRQHALSILMHDASHFRLLSSRVWNDRLSNWLLAYPLLVTTEGYRKNHLAHHLHLNTEADPDWVRKAGKRDWKFPKSKRALLLLLARDFCGGGFVDMLKAIVNLRGEKSVERAAQTRHYVIGRCLYYAVAAAAIMAAGLWLPVLVLWYLPAFTVLPVILRIRSIAEHFGLEAEHDLNMSRNTTCPLWERVLLAPHNIGYHLDHHIFPSVPFYNLPRLSSLLMGVPEYAALAHQNDQYLGVSRRSVLANITNRASDASS